MKWCLPGEKFNMVYMPPGSGDDVADVGINALDAAVRYKIPSATDVLVRREVWATICDFSDRCGALVETKSSGEVVSDGNGTITLSLTPAHGRFQRVVGAWTVGADARGILVSDVAVSGVESAEPQVIVGGFAPSQNLLVYVSYSVVPEMRTDLPAGSEWNPSVPKWFLDRYESIIVNGALMRIFAMTGKPWADMTQARMCALVYDSEVRRAYAGLLTSGMRKFMRTGAEDILIVGSQQAEQQQR